MTSTSAPFELTLNKIQFIIANSTGNDPEDITPESTLDEELNVTETDMTRIVLEINKAFNIALKPDDVSEEAENVKELALLVHEEAELG